MKLVALSSVLSLALAVPCLHAQSTTFGTYGDTTVVTSGGSQVYQLTSNPSMQDYSGIYVQFNSAFNASNLNTLSADFDMTQGTINNGAPRFSIGDTTSNNNNEAYVYFGTPNGSGGFTDPNPGMWENTGNLADLLSTDAIVEVNGFGGDSTNNTYETWSQFVANDGGVNIGFISIDVDGGSSNTQTADINNFDINGTLYNAPGAVPEPSSLALLGTTLLAGVGTMRRRFQTKAKNL